MRQSIDALSAQLAQQAQNLAPIATQAQALQAQLDQTQASIDADQRAYAARVRVFQADLRHLYAIGSRRSAEFLFSASSFGDLLNRIVYLDTFALAEAQLATRLRAEGERLQARRTALAQERQALEPLLEALQARVDAAAGAVASAAAYDSQLESARRGALMAIAGLASQTRSLQAALDRYVQQQAEQALRHPGGYGATCPPAAPAGAVRFCGHGWGHGVGLGQWGAMGMAAAGLSYRAIDQHFYRNTIWAQVDSAHTLIHVGILWGAGSYRVVPDGPAQLQAGGKTSTVNAGQVITLTASQGVQKITPLQPSTRLAVFTPAGLYHHYRGAIVGQPSNGILYVINELPIEDYLRGLGEVPASWPIEAIKAQIVAARCYALTHLGSTPLFDVDDTTRYQVYLGADNESAAQNAAVDQTQGQVLLSNGHVILAFFSASDGGHTANVSDIFGGSLQTYPYLTGVLDPWDVVAPRHTWYTGTYGYATLERIYFSPADVATYGHLVGLALNDRDASDRLNTVGLIGSRATKRIGVSAFIQAFNRSPLTGNDVLWNDMFGVTPANAWRYW
ncbi:MAG TPA: SpoIID/LytB domain-containing protein [Candidatus Limnocylindrales bacterium]|nr:SpoIID/LytB domain-containing protein [Candidatus Limnocylindrales bacterium]